MEKIQQLADRVGVKLAKRAARKSYAYNGESIALYDRERINRPETHIIHDIAHYAVAAKHRRKLPEFGLGSSPDITKFRGKLVVSGEHAQLEEELASALGIYWEREMGMDWKSTIVDHCWTEDISLKAGEATIFDLSGEHKFAMRLRELKKRNII